MIKNVTIDRDTVIRGTTKLNLVDLSYYAENNISDQFTITEIPKEHMDYINSVKYAGDCTGMFQMCRKLISIDLSKFDTRYVTDMGSMFSWCYKLTSINISNFNTSNVTNMEYMFYMTPITSINVSNFDTSNVTDMCSMFSECKSLTSLDLSNFDTSKVTRFANIFYHCRLLTTVKGTLDLSSCTNAHYMFTDTPKLRNVHLKNVPRSLLNTDGSLKDDGGTLNETYIIDNILEGK